MKIQTAGHLRGKIKLPGDKSISHRAAIFASLADGETRIENFAASADCLSTLDCLAKLGVKIRRENTEIIIEGVGKNGLTEPAEKLDCGNSGTTMRLLAGVLAGQNFKSVLIGDESLKKRPMRRIIEPLTKMNAEIGSRENCAPLRIFGKKPLKSIAYKLPVSSAQVKSCVLLAGLFADGETFVESPESEFSLPTSRNHTELMLKYLGAGIREEFVETNGRFVHKAAIRGDSRLTARDFIIPSDVSSAAFFLVAATCLENSEIVLENVGLNPTRSAIIEVLKKFGADIQIRNEKEICGEIAGDLHVKGANPLELNTDLNIIDGEAAANLIDEIPILAVFGTQLKNGLEIRNAEELRVKESDRIAATVENLRRMNAEVEEFPDGLKVEKSDLKGANVDSFGDHRIAMAFAVAALFANGETEIEGAEWAGISFPDFFQTLAELQNHSD